MPKVKLVPPDKLEAVPGPMPGERHRGAVETRLGISGAFPLHAGFRHLAPGAALEWTEVASGIVVYLWEGAGLIGGEALEPGSVVVIEHAARALIEAGPDGAVLLVFDAAHDAPPPDAAGGHVHVLPAARVQRTAEVRDGTAVAGAIFADAGCPTCRLWLHENTYQGNYELPLHSHSQDEIIVVTAGEMIVGNRRCGRGAMLGIAADVRYAFTCGAQGMQFVNFRPSNPTYTTADGSMVIDEAALYRGLFKVRPPYVETA